MPAVATPVSIASENAIAANPRSRARTRRRNRGSALVIGLNLFLWAASENFGNAPGSPHCCVSTFQSVTARGHPPASSVKVKRPDLAMQLAVRTAAGARTSVTALAWILLCIDRSSQSVTCP
ncbi:hypothetical protein GCM10023353_05020 [Tomitella cavernea]|uniref:Uncharacterized protein n=1 Tax=Tomitella cavernea TaxID=1387982 RepID=A0ABP9C6F1_9ACTN